MNPEILIIGAGVTGCAVARVLSRYEASITVLDRGADIAEGASKANSGIVHAGFDAHPGTLKAELNVKFFAECHCCIRQPYSQLCTGHSDVVWSDLWPYHMWFSVPSGASSGAFA